MAPRGRRAPRAFCRLRACRTRFSRASTEGTQFRRSHKKNAEKGTVGGRKIQERGCEDDVFHSE